MAEWRKIYYVPTLRDSRIRAFKEEYDLSSARLSEIVRYCPYVERRVPHAITLDHMAAGNDPRPGLVQELPVPGVDNQDATGG